MSITHPGRRHTVQAPISDPSPRALAFTVALGIALGVVLWSISGPPTLRASVDWAHIRATLTGSELAATDVVAVATGIAWLVLGYLALTIGLRAVAVTVTRITGGARWARSGLSLTNLITIPAVRRVVDSGVGGTLLVMSWLPDPSRAAAAPAATVVVVAPAAAPTEIVRVDESLPPMSPGSEHDATFIEYTVVRGDSLWDIARRLYGDGSRYVELWEFNRERTMTGGERFTDPRVIQPGWVLHVPLPTVNLSVDGQSAVYRVERGDDLWSIAARFLGDGFRWTEIWELNRHEEMVDARSFTNPNVLHTGWRLRLPLSAATAPASTVSPPTVEPDQRASERQAADPIIDDADLLGPSAGIVGDDTASAEGDEGSWDWPAASTPVLFTVAGFALIGGAVLSVYRLRRSGALASGLREAPRQGGGGDAGRVTLAAEAVASALAERGFDEARIALVFEQGDRLRIVVERIPWADTAIASLREAMARRLACRVEAGATAPGRVEVTLIGVNRLAASLAQRAPAPSTLVVPVGARDDEIVYLNLATGGIRLAGESAAYRAQLRSWVTTLVATHDPTDLALRVDAHTGSLLEDLAAAPHLAGSQAGDDVSDLLEELDEIIQTRLEDDSRSMPLVALIDGSEARRGALAAVLRDGPAVGVHLVVAGADDLTGAFEASLASANERYGPDEVETPGEGDPAMPSPGQVILQRKGEPDLALDPVLVRRDDSPRWRAGAELAASLASTSGLHAVSDGARHDPSPAVVLEPVEDADATEPDRESMVLGGAVEPGDGPVAPVVPDTDRPDVGPDLPAATLPSTGVLPASPTSTEPAGENLSREDAAPPEEVTAVVADAVNEPRATEQEEVTPAEDEDPTVPHPSNPPAPPPVPPVREEIGMRQASLLIGGAEPDEDRCAAGRPPFMVRCLGPFEVTVGGVPIEGWKRPKAPELIAFLVARGSSPVSREAVAAALWPEFPWDPGIDHMLANAAYAARAACRAARGQSGVQVLDTPRRGLLQLRTTLFASDLDEFEAALRRAARLENETAFDDYERAFDLYRGDFLEDVPAAWTDSYRNDYRLRYVEAARRAASLALACGNVDRATRYAQLVLGQEPADEAVARDLMRLLASVGDINGARKVYKLLGEALQRELDDTRATPAPDTRALLAELVGEVVDA
ncbi:MAG: hypothetical protein AMXMBFR23_02960 [Chloroflexota bacterium]